jgi:hypothetical protein
VGDLFELFSLKKIQPCCGEQKNNQSGGIGELCDPSSTSTVPLFLALHVAPHYHYD